MWVFLLLLSLKEIYLNSVFLFLAFIDVYKHEQKNWEKKQTPHTASLQSSVMFSFLKEKLILW